MSEPLKRYRVVIVIEGSSATHPLFEGETPQDFIESMSEALIADVVDPKVDLTISEKVGDEWNVTHTTTS